MAWKGKEKIRGKWFGKFTLGGWAFKSDQKKAKGVIDTPKIIELFMIIKEFNTS